MIATVNNDIASLKRYIHSVSEIPVISHSDLLSLYQDVGMSGFAGMSDAEFQQLLSNNREEIYRRLGENALSIENSESGSYRHFRKCNECRFQTGAFKNEISPDLCGIKSFPIISIENHMISSPIDRYFPGLLDTLQQGRPRTSFCQGYQTPWTLWMARCPRCGEWQELRAFRISGGHEAWVPYMGWVTWDGMLLKPEALKKACCNACFVAQNGRHALAEYLVRWFLFLIQQQTNDVHYELVAAPQKVEVWSGVQPTQSEKSDWHYQLHQIKAFERHLPSWYLSSCLQTFYKNCYYKRYIAFLMLLLSSSVNVIPR
ncbi:uncharacterized protein BKA55DRAFT_588037 [Fusarium redolens]|uniref:Uncharacterized protein n=1 Tax=Fusarium redolens TaxID=48865 RepID=A0A9P9KV27_FUSRE|nr:uncharacterized protein BKA55DRAFT_588037 [Fusarium redolens]KAH7269235.1 hypothetical protein BKA55DRAFT_588037 [Fusarium redolens]